MAEAMASQRGDSLAGFEDFYRRDYRLLIKVVLAAGASLDEAQEAVDQTMEELLRRWQQLTHPSAYARKAVVTNFVKRKKRDRERLGRTIKGGHVSRESQEDRELNVWEDEQWVTQLLAHLPPAQRDVMRCLVNGLRPTEIAELLGKTPDAIRKNLQLARGRLWALVHQDPDREYGRSKQRRPGDSGRRQADEA